MRRSRILEKLRAGKPALITNISISESPFAMQLAGRAGIDGVWIDMEHRPFTQREVSRMIAAAMAADIDAMPRIRKGEGYTSFFRPLEDGAAGIMVPHVKTREEAEWVVRNAKYPPIGHRGVEVVMPDADFGDADPMEYLAHANRETFVAIQFEDAEALDDLDGIMSVEGFDVAFVGPGDLSLSLGVPLQFDSPKFRDALNAIIESATRHGKWWGMPCANMEVAAERVQRGARFIAMGSDYSILKNAYAGLRREFDEQVEPSAEGRGR